MADEAPKQQFEIQKIYVKDLSLETPNSPAVFTQKWEPEINLQLNNSSAKLADDVYEVNLTITMTAKLGDKTAYLIEIQQAGIFGARGFDEAQLGAMLGAYCPNTLFPFARETIAATVQKAGFQPVLLTPVNFDALYMEHVKRQKQTNEADQKVAH